MLSTIRPLNTKQKVFIHFQRSYLSNSMLATGTLIQQHTRFNNICFPGGFIRLFARFKISTFEDNAPPIITTKQKSGLADNENETSKLDSSKKPNKIITDILKGYDRFRN